MKRNSPYYFYKCQAPGALVMFKTQISQAGKKGRRRVEIFHVMGEGLNIRALNMMQRPFNLLISAWTYRRSGKVREARALIREKAGLLLVDSGFLSAARQGKTEWANEQDYVIQVAEELQADRVVMMDIPCVPELLEAAGLSISEAQDLTYQNAIRFNTSQTRVKKGFVNQGWTLAERAECHRIYTDMGIQADWWAVGSVAFRRPETGLFEHVRYVRSLVEGHLHTLGIGNASCIRSMMDIGVNSCDSAAAALTTSYGKAIANGRQQALAPNDRLNRNSEMHTALYLYNMMAIEHDATYAEAVPSSLLQQERFDFG